MNKLSRGGLSLCLLVSSMGCATTTFESREVVSPSSTRLVRGEETSVQGAFHYEEGALLGTVSWSNACKSEEVHQVETQQVEVLKRSRPAGVLMVVAGVAGLVAGGYLLSTAGDGRGADYRSCADSSNDACKSPRELMTEAAITSLVMGATLGGVGTWSLASGTRETKMGAPSVRRSEVITPAVSCGRTEELAGLSLGMLLPDGATVLGAADTAGAVRIPLSAGSRMEGGLITVRIVTVPESLRDRLSPGMIVGEVAVPRPAAPVSKGNSRRSLR